jgi:hypothetical protein
MLERKKSENKSLHYRAILNKSVSADLFSQEALFVYDPEDGSDPSTGVHPVIAPEGYSILQFLPACSAGG